MHFRERGQIIQIIRTTYDAKTKKGKSHIVGRLSKARPEISEELRLVLSDQEIKEVAEWIKGNGAIEQLRQELAARTLTAQMSLAAEWLASHKGEDARFLAESLVPAWYRLRAALKRSGFVE